jgi:DNA-binding MarR family transcriptional regulator
MPALFQFARQETIIITLRTTDLFNRRAKLMSRFHHRGPGRILSAVQDNPGVSRGELASILGISGPVVSRSMQQLIKEGLIRQETDGKFRRYYPGWDPDTLSCTLNS